MSHYRTQLHPWCIIRLLPKAQRITVARFRKRNDAEAHMRTLKRLIPQAHFLIIFDPPCTGTAGSAPTAPTPTLDLQKEQQVPPQPKQPPITPNNGMSYPPQRSLKQN